MAGPQLILLFLLCSSALAQLQIWKGLDIVQANQPPKSNDSPDTVWGPPLTAEDFENAKKVVDRNITDVERKAIRDGIESEVFHRDKTSRIANSLVFGRWPNSEVPYELEAAFTTSDRAIIAAAMMNIMSNTCIRYRPRTAKDLDWMSITTFGVAGCYANQRYYGPGYGKHSVGLQSPGCMLTGIIVHEFLHILGIVHEMSRPDRDDYITVDWLNVNVKMAYNFWKADWDYNMPFGSGLPKCDDTFLAAPTDFSKCVSGEFVEAYGEPYDFNSVMHYSLDAFAVDPTRKTLIPKDPTVDGRYIGQQPGLSPGDIRGINRAYSCLATQPTYGGGNNKGCGGIINGTIPSAGNLQWTISADDGIYGIYINFTKWTCGAGKTCALEVLDGLDLLLGSMVVGSYNATNPPNGSLVIASSQVKVKFNATDPAVDFQAAWGCASVDCCSSVIFTTNNSDFLNCSVYAPYMINGTWSKNGTQLNGRPIYTHSSGVVCLWYNVLLIPGWLAAPCNDSFNIFSPSVFLFGLRLGIGQGFGSSCVEARQNWVYYSKQLELEVPDTSMKVACAPGVTTKAPQILAISPTSPTPATTPTQPATAIGGCCTPFYLNTTNQIFVNYSLYHYYVQGAYYPQPGSIFNGRQVYIHSNAYACMWYKAAWIIGACSSNKTTGFVFGFGDAPCPDFITRWAFVDPKSNDALVDDPSMSASCSPGVGTTTTKTNTTATATTTNATTTNATTTNATTTNATTTITTSTTISAGTESTNAISGSTSTNGVLLECPSCQVVVSGSFVGRYTFAARGDIRCPGGCVYWTTQETNQFCFQAEGAELVTNCT